MLQSPTHPVAATRDSQTPQALWPRRLEAADARTLGHRLNLMAAEQGF